MTGFHGQNGQIPSKEAENQKGRYSHRRLAFYIMHSLKRRNGRVR
jgi:hypothetical protein